MTQLRFSNPQAMAAIEVRRKYKGHHELSMQASVDADTWLTPRYILDQLGHFDLDPCAALVNLGWVRSARHFTVEDNGLEAEWSGRVFMNPPYSDTARWLRKHSEHGIGISLVPATVESVVWRECVWTKAAAVLLLHGRTRFSNPDGTATTGRPLRSVALIAWSPEDAAVLRKSTLAGVFLKSWESR